MNVHRDFDHLWRDRCDTSSQRAPRVLIRVFVAPGELERSVAFYEQLQGVVADAGFPFPDAGLRLAMVGAFLLIEGSQAALAPFTSTTGTLLVDDVRPYHDKLAPPAPRSSSRCRWSRPGGVQRRASRWHRGRIRASPAGSAGALRVRHSTADPTMRGCFTPSAT